MTDQLSTADVPPAFSRRHVIAGAAWGVTAVTLIAEVPAWAAASGPSVVFSAPAYHGPRCGQITGIRVTADAAGRVVVIQLSDGYAFSDGSTTSSLVTGTDCSADVGAVSVPQGAVPSTIVASTPGASSATATVAPASTASVYSAPSGGTTAASLPGDVTPVAGDLFLRGTTLWRSNGTRVQTDVDVVGMWAPSISEAGGSSLPIRLLDGTAVVYDQALQACTAASGVPAGATPVASDIFFVNGTLVRGTEVLATDVARYGALVNVDDGTGTMRAILPYTTADGRAATLRAATGESRVSPDNGLSWGVPSGSTPVAGDLFLAGTVLYRVTWKGVHAFGAGAVARDVGTCGLLTANPYFEGESLLPYVDTSGRAMLFMYSGNATRAASGIPSGATPLGADLFLLGSVLREADSGVIVSGVDRVGQASALGSSANSVVLPYTSSESLCVDASGGS